MWPKKRYNLNKFLTATSARLRLIRPLSTSDGFDILFLSVFFVSLSTLAFEVLLTRVFSIGQWNHLSFMVISIALFGFGASGTFLSIIDIRQKAWMQQLQSGSGITILPYLYSISAILSFLTLNHLPLDFFRLPVEHIQIVYLLAAYLMLALPFLFSGMLISIAYISVPEKTGLVYFASMSGSAIGAVIPIPMLPVLGEGKLIIITALASLIPAVFSIPARLFKNSATIKNRKMSRIFRAASGFTIIFLSIFIFSPTGRNLTIVKPSPYKALSHILQFPESRIVESKTSIRGRVDRVQTPYIRYAPGLSLKYTDALPRQHAVFKDGDNQLTLYDIPHNRADSRFATHLLSYAAYYLRRQPDSVLLIVSGGGSSIPCATAAGAGNVSVVVQSPGTAEILQRQYNHKIINRNPRSFLAQTRNDYDVIHIENWGASVPGTTALNQEHFFTIEAFTEYLTHLKPGGIVTVSRKLLLPPSDSLRMWATAYEAVKKTGTINPARHLAVLRNFDTFTLLVSNSAIDSDKVARFAGIRNFDLVFLHGMEREMANRYHIFDKPYHFEELNRLADSYRAGRPDDFFQRYLLDIAPQSDMRPFPGRFLKWSRVKMLYHSMGERLYALFMSGEIVVSLVFIEALFVALALLIIPLLVSTRGTRKPKFSRIVYFFAVGTGFMFVEIYFIKRFILLVGDPVISFSIVMAGILFFSGLGGIWVYKVSRQNLRLSLALLITVLVLEAFIFEFISGDILKASTGVQYLSIFLFLLPAGFLLGLPFPLGMRYILDAPVQRAYAWSVNGCASVLSSIMAAQIAVNWGIPQIAATGVFAYVIALWVVRKR